MSQARDIRNSLTQQEARERLGKLASRLALRPSAIRIRPLDGSRSGMNLTIEIADGILYKSCDSQKSRDKNLACLVLWLGDLVRNLERGIETFTEAFFNEGAQSLALPHGKLEGFQSNLYRGQATQEESFEKIERALSRLDLTSKDIHVVWDGPQNYARMTLTLKSGRTVVKTSSAQTDVNKNIHVLALWLQTKAKNYERGLEPNLETLFAANLLPA